MVELAEARAIAQAELERSGIPRIMYRVNETAGKWLFLTQWEDGQFRRAANPIFVVDKRDGGVETKWLPEQSAVDLMMECTPVE